VLPRDPPPKTKTRVPRTALPSYGPPTALVQYYTSISIAVSKANKFLSKFLVY